MPATAPRPIAHGGPWRVELSIPATGSWRGSTDRAGRLGKRDAGIVQPARRAGPAHRYIGYVGYSHLHADHAGNARRFPQATWLLSGRELDWARQRPTPPGVDAAVLEVFVHAKLRLADYDEDVFGDGRVRPLRAPGHSPGHRVLMLQLARAGTVMLCGDLYHVRASDQHDVVPPFNDSRADSLASFRRIAELLRPSHGRLIIRQDSTDFAALPVFPADLR